MLEAYIEKLMENMPSNFKERKCEDIDIVVEGGAFNGSYLIGAYYFLKELENKNYIKIRRISCCSISSICSLAYILDKLDIYNDIYKLGSESYRQTGCLNVYEDIFDILRKNIDINAYKKLNGRLYITYNNIKTCKQVTKSNFNSNEEIYEYIYRSGFIPLMIDKTIAKNNKYIDGFSPYFFKNNIKNRKTLYMCLVNWGYFENVKNTINVKNEVNSIRRVIAGTLDAHNFFMTGIPTQMCCYTDNMPISMTIQIELKKVFTYIMMIVTYWISYLIKCTSKNTKNTLIFKTGKVIIEELSKVFIQHYCC